MVEGGGGVFQFSGGRMTSRGQCPRGGCLWMSKSGGVFQFSGGRMTSRRQCPRGGGGGCLWNPPPPSGNPVSAPAICVQFRAINPSAPPNQSVPIRLWLWLKRVTVNSLKGLASQSRHECEMVATHGGNVWFHVCPGRVDWYYSLSFRWGDGNNYDKSVEVEK